MTRVITQDEYIAELDVKKKEPFTVQSEWHLTDEQIKMLQEFTPEEMERAIHKTFFGE